MNAPRGSRRRGRFAVAVALTLTGCAGAASSGPVPAAPPGAAPGASAASGTLDFTAPTVDGGRFDASTLAGVPAVLWFWAPL